MQPSAYLFPLYRSYVVFSLFIVLAVTRRQLLAFADRNFWFFEILIEVIFFASSAWLGAGILSELIYFQHFL